MDESFLVHKEKTHAYILHYFDFLFFSEVAAGQAAGVVLQIYFSIWERDDSVVTVVLGEVGANFISDEVEEAKLILEGWLNLFLFVVASLLDQVVTCFDTSIGFDWVGDYLVDA